MHYNGCHSSKSSYKGIASTFCTFLVFCGTACLWQCLLQSNSFVVPLLPSKREFCFRGIQMNNLRLSSNANLNKLSRLLLAGVIWIFRGRITEFLKKDNQLLFLNFTKLRDPVYIPITQTAVLENTFYFKDITMFLLTYVNTHFVFFVNEMC